MLKVIACDDEVSELNLLEALIRKYAALHPELAISFVSYQSSEELLSHIGKTPFQIYLLDVIMNGKDGIEIGREIRRIDERAAIIYTTVSPDYAVQSYTVDAFYYLLKPIEEKSLFPVLDKATGMIIRKTEGSLTIRTRNGIICVQTNKVLYIEYHAHRLSYHLQGGEIIDSTTFRESFDRVSETILKNRLLVKVSSSFIVNLAQVEKVIKKGFCMKDGMEITVSRPYSDVKKEYMDYILRGGGLHDF